MSKRRRQQSTPAPGCSPTNPKDARRSGNPQLPTDEYDYFAEALGSKPPQSSSAVTTDTPLKAIRKKSKARSVARASQTESRKSRNPVGAPQVSYEACRSVVETVEHLRGRDDVTYIIRVVYEADAFGLWGPNYASAVALMLNAFSGCHFEIPCRVVGQEPITKGRVSRDELVRRFRELDGHAEIRYVCLWQLAGDTEYHLDSSPGTEARWQETRLALTLWRAFQEIKTEAPEQS